MENKVCRCGFDRNHKFVIPNYKYSIFGWLALLLFGMSVYPRKLEYECCKCKDIIETITDPKILKQHAGR